jgi:transcriptional regulator with XRE-family HTH domain
MTTSKLGTLLEEIFHVDVVSREDWADALGVTKAAISQWANGRTVPGPDHLDAVRLLVTQDDRFPEDLGTRFEATLDRPIEEVLDSPRSSMGPTLRHYLVRPRREAAMRLLAALPPGEQIAVLDDLGQRVRQRLQHHESPVVPLKLVQSLPTSDLARLEQIAKDAQERKLTLPMCA